MESDCSRIGEPVDSIDALLPDADQHTGAYLDALADELADAAVRAAGDDTFASRRRVCSPWNWRRRLRIRTIAAERELPQHELPDRF